MTNAASLAGPASCTVERALGGEALLKDLYSYPNLRSAPQGKEGSLADTIKYYVDQSLLREGFAAEGVTAKVSVRDGQHTLELTGPAFDEAELETFASRLVEMLEHGQAALVVIARIRERGKRTRKEDPKPWNPEGHDWRPFFGHGLPMVRQRCVQFFHYPPIRLLDPYRDYLHDPVPRKVELLLLANIGWDELLRYGEEEVPWDRQRVHQLALYERVVDGCPVAAPDEDGSAQVVGLPEGVKGYMPMEDFPEYQRQELALFTREHEVFKDFTIPLVAYGGPAAAQLKLKSLFEAKPVDPGGPSTPGSGPWGWGVSAPLAGVIEIHKGKKTPFVTCGHPYALYANIQGGETGIGQGHLVVKPGSGPAWEAYLRNDLAVARWTLAMAGDPTQDPVAKLRECKGYWDWAEQRPRIQALLRHLGSYRTDKTLAYDFCESLADAEKYVHDHPSAPYGA